MHCYTTKAITSILLFLIILAYFLNLIYKLFEEITLQLLQISSTYYKALYLADSH